MKTIESLTWVLCETLFYRFVSAHEYILNIAFHQDWPIEPFIDNGCFQAQMSHTFLHFLHRHDTLFCFPGHDEYRAKQRLGRHDKVSKASTRGVSEKSNRTVNELSALPGFPSFHTGTSADRLVLAVTGASAPAAPKGFSLARGPIGACAVSPPESRCWVLVGWHYYWNLWHPLSFSSGLPNFYRNVT